MLLILKKLVCLDIGHMVSARQVGLVGSHSEGKMQPFMVAFFRSHRPSSGSQEQHQLSPSLDDASLEETDNARISRKASGRFRRQASGAAQKRNKDSDDFGSWNPYTGNFVTSRMSSRC